MNVMLHNYNNSTEAAVAVNTLKQLNDEIAQNKINASHDLLNLAIITTVGMTGLFLTMAG